MSDKNSISRRDFIKSSALACTAMAVAPAALAEKSSFDAKGLPTRTLGKTGVEVPLMAVGCGSRFMAASTERGLEILEHALDNGLYYWDTAANYKNDYESSEERLGRMLKNRRKEVFLATKVAERDTEGAKRTIERSLQRLQTDYIDLYQIHSIKQVDDAKNLQEVLAVLRDYQRQGVIRHIGFTGHTSAEAMTYAAQNYDFDTMLIALNHMAENQNFEQMAVPAAAAKNMGVIGMKVIRPRETVESLTPEKLIKYSLSLDHLSAANVSNGNLDILKANLEILRNFKPLPAEEMQNLRGQLSPFFRSKELPWMQPGYQDGQWV